MMEILHRREVDGGEENKSVGAGASGKGTGVGGGRKSLGCIVTARKIVDRAQIRSDRTCTVYYNLEEGLLADKFFI